MVKYPFVYRASTLGISMTLLGLLFLGGSGILYLSTFAVPRLLAPRLSSQQIQFVLSTQDMDKVNEKFRERKLPLYYVPIFAIVEKVFGEENLLGKAGLELGATNDTKSVIDYLREKGVDMVGVGGELTSDGKGYFQEDIHGYLSRARREGKEFDFIYARMTLSGGTGEEEHTTNSRSELDAIYSEMYLILKQGGFIIVENLVEETEDERVSPPNAVIESFGFSIFYELYFSGAGKDKVVQERSNAFSKISIFIKRGSAELDEVRKDARNLADALDTPLKQLRMIVEEILKTASNSPNESELESLTAELDRDSTTVTGVIGPMINPTINLKLAPIAHHVIRNELNGILGLSAVIKIVLNDRQELMDIVNRMQRAVLKITDFVDKLRRIDRLVWEDDNHQYLDLDCSTSELYLYPTGLLTKGVPFIKEPVYEQLRRKGLQPKSKGDVGERDEVILELSSDYSFSSDSLNLYGPLSHPSSITVFVNPRYVNDHQEMVFEVSRIIIPGQIIALHSKGLQGLKLASATLAMVSDYSIAPCQIHLSQALPLEAIGGLIVHPDMVETILNWDRSLGLEHLPIYVINPTEVPPRLAPYHLPSQEAPVLPQETPDSVAIKSDQQQREESSLFKRFLGRIKSRFNKSDRVEQYLQKAL